MLPIFQSTNSENISDEEGETFNNFRKISQIQ